MTVPGNLSSPLLATAAAGAAAAAGPIKSVRFNKDHDSYLSRTPSSAGNRKTWTWSGWIKLGKEQGNDRYTLFECTENFPASGNPYGLLNIVSGMVGFGEASGGAYTTSLFKDHGSFYHIVAAMDTTQSTAADRLKLYINGVQYSHYGYTFTQNADTAINQQNVKHSIGREENSDIFLADLYMADVYFIDGQQLDCTSFGAFDSNGVWQAAAYSATFGTNGFHLFDFANESTLGHDSSGNNNDFTAFNVYSSDGSTLSPSVYGNFASGSLAGAFDGSTASGDRIGVRPNGSGVSFTAQTVSSKLRVYCGVESGQGTLYINKTINTSQAPSRSSPSYVDVTSSLGNLPFTLTDVGFHGGGGGAGADIYAIEVDNTVLVNTSFTNDISRDVPTNGDSSDDTGAGGELSSNYCVFNPLTTIGGNSGTSSGVLSEGNTRLTNPASNAWNVETGTIAVQSGKWYYEFVVSGTVSNFLGGWADPMEVNYNDAVGNTSRSYGYYSTGNVRNGNSNTSFGSSYTAGDTIGCAIDIDNRKIYWSKNGTWQNSANPAAGTASIYTIQDPVANNFFYTIAVSTYDASQSVDINTGQKAFSYNAPSGFKALCTSNLSTPIADGSAHFESKLYTGNGSTNALTMSNSSMSPDWVWIHSRSTTGDHEMFDIIRGANQVLESNGTNQSNSVSNTLTSFDSNGFTLGSSSLVNDNNVTYVAWCWDGGSSNATNTNGSVNSTVRANATAGFSIVKWTGTGSAETVGHGLGAKPHLIFSHRISGSGQWPTYNAEIGATKYMYLNSSIEARTYQHFWNNTEPTSSVFSIGTDADVSANGGTHIAYCFAPVAGYQAMGKYSGTGNSNGAFVHTGFKPALVMIKRISAAESWVFYDTSRDTSNPTVTRAWADLNLADSSNTSHFIDIYSNGFKVKSGGGLLGASGSNYFYWAIAENPFQANGGLAR